MYANKYGRGFTMLELMIVLVIAAIGMALAVPTYRDVTQRRETTAQAQDLAAFLSYAQTQAMKANKPISVELDFTASTNWCIGAAEGLTGCDCTGVDTDNLCTIDGATWTMGSATQKHSSLEAPAPSSDPVFAFDPTRGTMIGDDLTPAHVFDVQSDSGKYKLRVDVGATGRIKVCNPDSSKKVHGFPACT